MPCELPYTTADEIRSTAGVDSVDVTDEMMRKLNIGVEMTLDLAKFLPDHADRYAAGILPGATDEDRNVSVSIVAYCKYWGAAYLLGYMQLAIPYLIRDGKNELRRFEDIDLDALAERMSGKAKQHQEFIEEEVGSNEAAVAFGIMGSAVPDYDPVTNT